MRRAREGTCCREWGGADAGVRCLPWCTGPVWVTDSVDVCSGPRAPGWPCYCPGCLLHLCDLQARWGDGSIPSPIFLQLSFPLLLMAHAAVHLQCRGHLDSAGTGRQHHTTLGQGHVGSAAADGVVQCRLLGAPCARPAGNRPSAVCSRCPGRRLEAAPADPCMLREAGIGMATTLRSGTALS